MQVFNSDQLLELKYCERCGGLWLRAKGAAEVYCRACSREMAEYPAARLSKGKRRARPGRTLQAKGLPLAQVTAATSWSGSVL
jgi:Zn-finger nucleic acid-binding protein